MEAIVSKERSVFRCEVLVAAIHKFSPKNKLREGGLKPVFKQFVEQYDNALKKKIEKEKYLDFGSFNSMIPVITGYPIERQFQSFYTNNLFKLFQDEIRGLMFCNTSLVRQEGVAFIFEVVETLLGKNGDPIRDASFKACDLCIDTNEDAKEKLIAIQTDHSRADQLKEASTSSSKTIHSPLKVRSRGRPPTKRKQCKIEQIVKKSVAKARKKVIEGPTVSVEELNNMENGKHDSLVHSDGEKRFED
ncbi:hypothetical protein ZIOFF_034352 [Zingiber officinale]|uniref:Protein FAR1-RELATED SEQUENCE n=1 Tax=Zingiber officinale TaxID=94328 RepID=A0A8J5L2F1_ZINOF|nr:hypothetical protein ZIOFF_034352 [Zingiber officinale]